MRVAQGDLSDGAEAARDRSRSPSVSLVDLELVEGGAPGDGTAGHGAARLLTDRRVTVIVVAAGDGSSLAGCLAAVGAQRHVPGFDVIVADRPSSGSPERARAHPVVDRVVLATDAAPGALVGRPLWSLHGGVAVVVPETGRPDPDWLSRVLAALATGTDAVSAPMEGGTGVALDVGAVREAWWRDGIPRVPAGDTPPDLRGWLDRAGLRVRELGPVPDGPSTLRVLPWVSDEPPDAAAYDGRISVVVCSHGRPDALARCLRSLERLEDPDHEVLVVDNGRVPQYDAAAIGAAGHRYVHEPRRGLDHARNRGFREATGAVVAYVDDDCEVDPRWLTGIRRAMGDPAVGLVTGRVVPASLSLSTERWFEAWFGFDRGMLPDRAARDDTRPWAAFYPSLLGTGANMAYRREALEAIGGFDELLDVGSAVGGGGDIDAFARILDTGAVGAYEPSAVVHHHHRTDVRALRRQFFGYGQALGAVCVKYALDRPGHKRAAVRFYRERLRDQWRRARLGRARVSELPRSLTLLEIAGQLHGPLAYLASRARSRRRR